MKEKHYGSLVRIPKSRTSANPPECGFETIKKTVQSEIWMILVLVYDCISWVCAERLSEFKRCQGLTHFQYHFFDAEVIGHNLWIHIKELSKQMKRKSSVNIKHQLADSCKMYSSIKISFILLAHLSNLFQFSPIQLLEPTHLHCNVRMQLQPEELLPDQQQFNSNLPSLLRLVLTTQVH